MNIRDRQRRAKLRHAAVLIALVLVTFSVWGVMIVQWRSCNDRGGHYVRGLFWMECVDHR